MTYLFLRLLKDDLREYTYAARLAGLVYGISSGMNAILVSMGVSPSLFLWVAWHWEKGGAWSVWVCGVACMFVFWCLLSGGRKKTHAGVGKHRVIMEDRESTHQVLEIPMRANLRLNQSCFHCFVLNTHKHTFLLSFCTLSSQSPTYADCMDAFLFLCSAVEWHLNGDVIMWSNSVRDREMILSPISILVPSLFY